MGEQDWWELERMEREIGKEREEAKSDSRKQLGMTHNGQSGEEGKRGRPKTSEEEGQSR